MFLREERLSRGTNPATILLREEGEQRSKPVEEKLSRSDNYIQRGGKCTDKN
jgi:hypothetical protein